MSQTPPAQHQPPRAAQEAAEFVARLFADLHPQAAAPGSAPAAPALTADAPADAPADTAADTPADPPPDPPAPGARPLALPLEPLGFQGKSVLVLGLGISGLSMARWALRCGAAQVTVLDDRAEPPQLPALRSDCAADWASGRLRFACALLAAAGEWGAECDLVLRSPGLSPQQLAPVQAQAARRGVRLAGEWELFCTALAALGPQYAPRLVGITGSNGKTTTAALCAHLLRAAGQEVALAGNIGPALLDTLAGCLQANARPRFWVLELSSFQLHDAPPAEVLTTATVLNLSADHLDWHGSAEACAAAKARIFAGAQTCPVLNRDDAAVLRMLPPPAAPEKTARGKPREPLPRAHVRFGSDCPGRTGDFGLETAGGVRWLVRAGEGANPDEAPPVQRLMPLEALQIRGQHNALNALAALALLHGGCGLPLGPLLHGLRSYAGEPHRIEPVARLGELHYIDDSKGTNVAATVAALEAVGEDCAARVVIILGGDGKGQDFAALRPAVLRHARAAVLLGRDAPRIRAALQGCGLPLMDAHDMPDAVARATQHALGAWPQARAAVLLSPACASLDMFANYAERARCFVAAAHGQVAIHAHNPGEERT